MIRDIAGPDVARAQRLPERAAAERLDAERFTLPEAPPEEPPRADRDAARGPSRAQDGGATRRADDRRRDDADRDDDERDDDAVAKARERALAWIHPPLWEALPTGGGPAVPGSPGVAVPGQAQAGGQAQAQAVAVDAPADEGEVATDPSLALDADADGEAAEEAEVRPTSNGAIAAEEGEGGDRIAATAARRAELRAAAQAAAQGGADGLPAGAVADDVVPAWLLAGQRRDPAAPGALDPTLDPELLLTAADGARSAQRAEALQRVDPARAASLADEVTEALRAFVRESAGDGVIKIDSARFGGRLSAFIRTDGGELVVHLRADDPAVRALVAGAVDEVRSALEAADLGLGDVSVSSDGDPRDAQGGDAQDRDDAPRATNTRRAHPAAQAARRHDPHGVRPSGGRLDIIV